MKLRYFIFIIVLCVPQINHGGIKVRLNAGKEFLDKYPLFGVFLELAVSFLGLQLYRYQKKNLKNNKKSHKNKAGSKKKTKQKIENKAKKENVLIEDSQNKAPEIVKNKEDAEKEFIEYSTAINSFLTDKENGIDKYIEYFNSRNLILEQYNMDQFSIFLDGFKIDLSAKLYSNVVNMNKIENLIESEKSFEQIYKKIYEKIFIPRESILEKKFYDILDTLSAIPRVIVYTLNYNKNNQFVKNSVKDFARKNQEKTNEIMANVKNICIVFEKNPVMKEEKETIKLIIKEIDKNNADFNEAVNKVLK